MTEMIKEFLLLDQDYKFKWRDLFAIILTLIFFYGFVWFMILVDVAING